MHASSRRRDKFKKLFGSSKAAVNEQDATASSLSKHDSGLTQTLGPSVQQAADIHTAVPVQDRDQFRQPGENDSHAILQPDLQPNSQRIEQRVFNDDVTNSRVLSGEGPALQAYGYSGSNTPIPVQSSTSFAPTVSQKEVDSRSDHEDDLWTSAYQKLKETDPILIEAYEAEMAKLSSQPDHSSHDRLDYRTIKSLVDQRLERREASRLVLHLAGKPIKIREVGESIVKTVLWSNTFIGAALSSQPYAALAWSGVSVLLPLVLNSSKQSQAMMDGFKTITNLMQLCRVREDLYKNQGSTDYLAAVVDLYAAIFKYEAQMIVHLSKRALDRGISGTFEQTGWKDSVSEVQACSERCNAFTGLIDREREMDQLSQIVRSKEIQHKLLTEFKAHRELLCRQHQDETEAKLMETLASDYQSDKEFVAKRIDGTCEWFFEDERFTNWRDSSSSCLLWVSANPGFGKSVLSRALIDDNRLSKSTISTTVCYWFFKDGQARRMHSANALSAILHQLFSIPTLAFHAITSYRNYGSKLCESLPELWNILLSSIKDPLAGEVICVIDALDECEGLSRNQLIEYLISFYSSHELTSDPSFRLKILVTSRPYDNIESQFQRLSDNSSYVRFEGDEKSEQIGHEINLVIDVKVEEFARSFKPSDRVRIAERLKQMEHRTYLWLFLTIDIIERSRSRYAKASSIDKLLSDLPKEVNDAYEKILSRSTDEELARTLLLIVVGAERPLSLEEANVALTMATQEPSCSWYAELEQWPSEEFASVVRNICGLLVTVHDEKLSLLHQTAREFLTASTSVCKLEESRWRGCCDLGAAHKLLSEVCVRYLSLEDFRGPLNKCNEVLLNNSLLDSTEEEWVDLELGFAVTYDVPDIVELFLKEGDDPEAVLTVVENHGREHSINALALAIRPKDEKMVNLLVAYSPQPFKWTTLDVSPLGTACSEGDLGLVKRLLALGANANSSCQKDMSSLEAAMFAPKLEIIHLLIENGADIDRGCLKAAMRSDNADALAYLFDHSKEDFGAHKDHLLSIATGLPELNAMKVLIESGANVNYCSPADSLLYYAMDRGFEDAAWLLISSGADVNARGDERESPLRLADSLRMTNTVKLLEARGARDLKSYDELIGPLTPAYRLPRKARDDKDIVYDPDNLVRLSKRDELQSSSSLNIEANEKHILKNSPMNFDYDTGDYDAGSRDQTESSLISHEYTNDDDDVLDAELFYVEHYDSFHNSTDEDDDDDDHLTELSESLNKDEDPSWDLHLRRQNLSKRINPRQRARILARRRWTY